MSRLNISKSSHPCDRSQTPFVVRLVKGVIPFNLMQKLKLQAELHEVQEIFDEIGIFDYQSIKIIYKHLKFNQKSDKIKTI